MNERVEIKYAVSKLAEVVKIIKKINQSQNRGEKNVYIIYQVRDKWKIQNNLVKVNPNIRNYYIY